MINDARHRAGKRAVIAVVACAMVAASVASAPSAYAQSAAGDVGACAAGSFLAAKISGYVSSLFGGSSDVPVGDSQSHAKEFSLDRLASCAAKAMLHQMTVATVQWINSGFKGGPAFIKNPSAFFLDAADQFTGQFISQNGPLRQLCSPWNVDIRLGIAIEQANTSEDGLYHGRYYCTLGNIIENAKYGNVNVSADVQATDQDVQNFVNGDFAAGGWDGFLSLVTDPGSNPNSAYLYAKADRLSAVSAKRGLIQADLNMGLGFLSQTECTDLSAEDLQRRGLSNNADASVGEDGDFTNPDGASGAPDSSGLTFNDGKWQRCQTVTPGSTVANMLQTQLNVPADELKLADNINAVVNALVNQMVYQVLNKGLSALSSSGSGASWGGAGGTSAAYISQLSSDLQQRTSANQTDPAAQNVQAVYFKAIDVVNTAQKAYTDARVCLAGLKLDNAPIDEIQQASSDIAAIDEILLKKLAPLLSSLSSAQLNVSNLAGYSNIDWQTSLYTANQAYSNAISQTDGMVQEAAQYQTDCATFAQH